MSPTLKNNLKGLRSYPNTWIRSKDEWKYFRDERKFRKRCLFNVNQEEKIHLASLDTISNQHLLPAIKFPYEDDIFRALGQKRNMIDKRNGFEEFAPGRHHFSDVKSLQKIAFNIRKILTAGDKSYRSVEYSNEYFARKNRNWRDDKFKMPKVNF